MGHRSETAHGAGQLVPTAGAAFVARLAITEATARPAFPASPSTVVYDCAVTDANARSLTRP